MNRRRARGIVVHGLALPAATVAVVGVVAVALGYDLGMAILVLSMAAAALTAGLFLTQTRNMQPDTSGSGREERSAMGLRSELTENADVSNDQQIVITRYATGLFVLSALAVLYLGGLFAA
jgi:hypothetical protein